MLALKRRDAIVEEECAHIFVHKQKNDPNGKGMWCYLTSKELPSLTVIGSPNYGYRSVKRDLECEVAIVTENKKLQKQLQDEHQHMYSTSSPVTESTFKRDDRYVALWIRAVTSIIKRFF